MALFNDLRFAWRSLRKNPFFSLVVIAILGLGMGAATAVVDLTNLLAWRLLPVERPEELVRVYTGHLRGFSGPWGFTSYADYLDYREDTRALATLAAHRDVDLRLDSGEQTRLRTASAVSGTYFDTLGLRPSRGRGLGPADERPGAEPVLVLSHHLWHRLGADPEILGTSMKIEGEPFTVVGVGPRGFKTDVAGSVLDFFVPLQHVARFEGDEELLTDRNRSRFYLTGRLAPGRSRAEAQTEIAHIARRLDSDFPLRDDKKRSVSTSAARMAHPIDLDRTRPSLRLFAVAVALLLAITCANVAHLLLSRAASRRREMAVRQSLGARRGLLVRQLLVENLLLALAGGLVGLWLAWWGRAYMSAFAGDAFAAEMRFDWRVLLATFLVCLATTLLFGLAPALATSRIDLRQALHDSGGGGTRREPGGWLAGAQIALSVVLVTAGTLLFLSLHGRLEADLGFDDGHLLIAAVSLPSTEYPPEEGRLFFDRLRERAAALPGVEAAGRSLLVPPLLFDIRVPFRLPDESESERTTRINFVDSGYFDTMGISLERGRTFAAADTADSPPVIVVNRAMADELWPGEDPIGRGLEFDGGRPSDSGPSFTVVGVASNVDQYRSSFGGEPIIYFAAAQKYRPRQQLVLRSTADPEAVFANLRETLREMDPGLALDDPRTGRANREFAFTFERMQVTAVTFFASSGLLLSVLGLFAVLSYGVSRRTRAIGIRMAIGARGADIRRHVLGRGLRLAFAGSAVGLLALVPASRWLDDLLFQVKVSDPRVIGAALAVVLATAVAAAVLPARRASRLDPLEALRHE